jgi:hypothetical protein
VNSGSPIGFSGSTCNGTSSCPAHLHFEVKTKGTLGSSGNDNPEWGYSRSRPDLSGWLDPILNLHNATLIPPIRVTVTDNNVPLRVGPGGNNTRSPLLYYRSFRQLNRGEQYYAIRRSGPTAHPSCSQGWYQIVGAFPDPAETQSYGGYLPYVI